MQSSQATHPVWTAADKKKLYELLQMLPLNAYNNIAMRVKTKTAEQVKVYIDTLKHAASYMYNENAGAKSYEDCFGGDVKVPVSKGGSCACVAVSTIGDESHPRHTVEKAPIEDWVELTQTLVDQEDTDLSAQLGQAMSIISHLEAFPEGSRSDGMQPNYRAIYHYLGQLLKGEELDALAPLESALLLEIFHSLMEVLSGADTSVQRNIMRWKHQLISTRSIPSLRKVVENDFSDFLNDDTILVEDEPEEDMVDTHNSMIQQARRNSPKEKATAKHKNTPVGAPNETTTTAATADSAMDSADDTYIASPISSPMSTHTPTPQSHSSSTATAQSQTGSTPTHQPPSISTATEQLPSSTETPPSLTSSTSTTQPSCSSATTSGGSTQTQHSKPKPKIEYVIVMPPENATIVTKIIKHTARKSFPHKTTVPSKSHKIGRSSIEPTVTSRKVATTDRVAETLKVKGAISKKLKVNLEKAKASGRADQKKNERSTGDRVDKEPTQGTSNTLREEEVNENTATSSTASLVAGTSATVETNSTQEQQTSVRTSIAAQINTAWEELITAGASASAQTHSTQEQLTASGTSTSAQTHSTQEQLTASGTSTSAQTHSTQEQLTASGTSTSAQTHSTQEQLTASGTSTSAQTHSTQEQLTASGTSTSAQTHSTQEQLTASGTSTSAQTHSTQEQLTQQSKEKKESWKRKLIPTKSPADFPKKPKLYSLNPLCIPVTLLDLHVA